ncbi:unnamed protein product, partial [Candidula unifasciata]
MKCEGAPRSKRRRKTTTPVVVSESSGYDGQGEPHSPGEAHDVDCGGAPLMISEEVRSKIRFPPASEKVVWCKLEATLCEVLKQTLNKKSLGDKLTKFGDVIYEHCSREFGTVVKAQPGAKQNTSRRQRDILKCRADKNALRKQFKAATGSEREGLYEVWVHLKNKHSALCRAERFCNNRRRTKREREKFFRDPYQFARGLFEQPKSGTLVVSQKELELHLSKMYSDKKRREPLDDNPEILSGLKQPSVPKVPFKLVPPLWSEVEDVVKKASGKSAPGPNGVPYVLYKRCPKILKMLHVLLRQAWIRNHICPEWSKANGVYIPKEQDSKSLSQFRPISLLNVEGKIFFSVMARRLTQYLMTNKYIDTSVQKGGIPGVPGCLEHATMIWEAIQRAKHERTNLHVIWLDLANAYGAVPHRLLWRALRMFHVPTQISQMVEQYFSKFALRFSTSTFTTRWTELQIGIAMGCTISPILFVMAMQIMLDGAAGYGLGLQIGDHWLPPLRAFMDDTTIITGSEESARTILNRLDAVVQWSGMQFKPQKSRSLSIHKGKVSAISFTVARNKIPTVLEEPVKSLGRVYDSKLSDRAEVRRIHESLATGLLAIERCRLIGKFKVWCLQFMLIPKLLWPLLVYEVTMTAVEAMEKKINTALRKWIGAPPCLTDVALYCKQAKLVLPFKSITEEFK